MDTETSDADNMILNPDSYSAYELYVRGLDSKKEDTELRVSDIVQNERGLKSQMKMMMMERFLMTREDNDEHLH
ncbi:hypothetical protein M8J75_009214 [Diaphorina citri]|nr:hypothetical protein M8J75_009214 [Diaphorina citri]